MKKAYKTRYLSTCILTTLSGLVLVSSSFGQSAQKSTTVKQKKGYVTKWKQIPFDHQVFIENNGQFDGIIPGHDKILYGAELGNVWAYFTLHGVEFKYTEHIKKDNGNNGSDPDEDIKLPVPHYMKSTWDNPNLSASIEATGKQGYYYTYPKGTNATIKTDIFKKITYQNIYPGIDIEYIFPKGKEGLEYSIILNPGADISKVKLIYETLGGLKLEKNGNVTFNSEIGEFTDHSPVSYYSHEAENIAVSYKVEGNTESFSINEAYDKSKTLVIDPWSTDPLFTGTYDRAYDLDYDYKGDVYAYGSWLPCQLEKFNNLGVPQWVFNASAFDVYDYYGDVAVNRISGTAYITEGFNASGARAMKINANGFLVATSPGTPLLNEFWRAVYNPCNDNIIIGAGGTSGDNQACILDTTMLTVTPVNVLSAHAALHDMVLIAPDPSGLQCYMATAKSAGDPTNFNNEVMQLPLPTLLPPTYLTPDNFKFQESNVAKYVGPGSSTANGFNGMAASPNWLYIYNGATLKRLVKTTGLLSDSIFVSNTLTT